MADDLAIMLRQLDNRVKSLEATALSGGVITADSAEAWTPTLSQGATDFVLDFDDASKAEIMILGPLAILQFSLVIESGTGDSGAIPVIMSLPEALPSATPKINGSVYHIDPFVFYYDCPYMTASDGLAYLWFNWSPPVVKAADLVTGNIFYRIDSDV